MSDTKEYPTSDFAEGTAEDAVVHVENPHVPQFDKAGNIVEGRVQKTSWTPKRCIAVISLFGIYVGATLPLFFLGASLSFIAADIGSAATSGWVTTVYSVLLASIAPFVGYIQDLIGRRYIAILGSCLLCLGLVIIGTAHSFSQLAAGSGICGAGAGITELTAIAGAAELVSISRRGWSLAFLTAFILPFCPYVLYAQLLGEHASWRWGIWISLIYNGVALLGLVCTYFPRSPGHESTAGRRKVLQELDLIGGILSIGGIVMILVAIQSGGSIYSWGSAKVIAPLIIGALFCLAFVFWEWKFAKHPMIPAAMFNGQRITGGCLAISFVCGMNLFAMLNFMPLAFATIYDPDPLQVGLKGLGFGFSATAGGTLANICLSVFKNNNREVLLVSCLLMTVFTASLASMTPFNPQLAIGLSTIGGLGIGGVIVPSATIALSACLDAYLARVVAMVNSLRYLGGAIGFSIYYSVFSQRIAQALPSYVAKYAIEAGLPITSAQDFVGAFISAPKTLDQVKGVTASIIANATIGARWAYADTLKYVWYASIPFGVICVTACCFIGNNKKFLTDRVVTSLE